MKKQASLSILLLLIFYLNSCREWEDSFSNGSLYDTWEIVDFNDNQQLDRVTTLIISKDGTFEQSTTYKEPNSNTIVGYYFITNGTYILDGNTISFLTLESRFIGNDKPYGEISELIPVNFPGGGPPDPLITLLEYRDNGSKLVVNMPCNDVLNALCAAAPVYSRAR